MGHTIPGRSLVLLDLAAVLWVAGCIVLGLLVSSEVRGLSRTGDAVVDVGRQVEDVGVTLTELGDVPLVGGRIAEAGQSVRRAGVSAQRSGAEAQGSTDTLSTLLGIAVILIPVSPLLLFYLPLRLARARDTAALRTLSARADDDPELQHLLAQRALLTLPYRELAALSGRPWADTGRRDDARLAEAEVDREVGEGAPWPSGRRAG